jgi:patatin-like phospholipase/acyl hydrolase
VTCRANQTDDGRQFVQLRSYPTPQDMPEEYTFPEMKIWEAARATSAAPAYFDQLRIGEDRFIDGGMVYNNPVPL